MTIMRRLFGRLFARSLLALSIAAGLALPVDAGQLGVNSGEINDWHPGGQIFTDVMKQARHFGSRTAPWDESAAVDANGWPNGDAGAVIQTVNYNIGGT